MDTIFIAPLEQLGREDLDWAGGKGVNLGELVKAGFLVPKGLVITTSISDWRNWRRPNPGCSKKGGNPTYSRKVGLSHHKARHELPRLYRRITLCERMVA